MRRASIGTLFLLGTATLACAPLRPPALDPSGLADPAAADGEPDAGASLDAGRPSLPPESATVPSVKNEEPPPIARREPIAVAGCPLRWTPKPLHASVLSLPAEMAARFMVPLYEAACACTRPGDRLALVARIVPELGEITVATAARDEPAARVEPGVDACLAAVRAGRTFETFELGSDVVCPEPPPPPRSPGPPFFRAPRMAGCGGGPSRSLIVYPLIVDRTGE